MRNRQAFFIIFCLILTLGLIQSYQAFENYFSALGEIQFQQAQLKKNLEQEKLKTALVLNEFQDFKQTLSQVLPKSSFQADQLADYQQQSLASTLRRPAQEKSWSSDSLMSGAKGDFRDKNYTLTIEKLNRLLKEFATSPHQVEAHFLLAESYFLLGELESSLEQIELMSKQYPDHPLTGHILLRLGLIYESRRRPAEAKSVYQIIQSNFKDQKDLFKQAKKNEKQVED